MNTHPNAGGRVDGRDCHAVGVRGGQDFEGNLRSRTVDGTGGGQGSTVRPKQNHEHISGSRRIYRSRHGAGKELLRPRTGERLHGLISAF